MAINELKAVLAVVTLAAGFAGGLSPIVLRRGGSATSLVGVGNAFSAGLFLAIGLLHFLPESATVYRNLGLRYPMASLLAVAAFLFLLLLEHVLLPDAAHSAAHAHSGDGRHHHDHSPEPAGGLRAAPWTLVFALSIHSVLAGFALGADADVQGVMLTFTAIIVHKGIAGLALGLALMAAGLGSSKALKLVAAFALMTPLGILAGTVAGGTLRGDAHQVFDAAAGALAAGTFLYIGAFDLLQDEFLGPGRRWAKWASAVVGGGAAALLAAWL